MDLNIFEKLREIYNAARNIAWQVLGIAGLMLWAVWAAFTWLPARAVQLIDWVKTKLLTVNVDLNSVPIDWARINQFIPVNEIVVFGATYLALAGAVTLVKWVRKLLPF
jgi:hypothetical protein